MPSGSSKWDGKAWTEPERTFLGSQSSSLVPRVSIPFRSWLKVNGEAIYKSQPWTYQNDTLTGSTWYTTVKPQRSRSSETHFSTVYAIVLEYPYKTNSVQLGAFSNQVTKIVQITMLGYATELKVGS